MHVPSGYPSENPPRTPIQHRPAPRRHAPIARLGALLLSAGLATVPATAALAETLGKVGGWTIARSAEMDGCTMATKYASGAYLFLSASVSGAA